MHSGDIQPLLRYCSRVAMSSGFDRELNVQYAAMSALERDDLGRWLRRIH